MKILYIRLVNFIGVKAAMGLDDISFSFTDIDKPIIQLYGKNRCGKTVMIQQMHPYSSINLNGDERGDLSLIIPGNNGLKIINYEVDGKVYCITHTYRANPKGHQVSSSIMVDGKELNESGGVNNFNQIIEDLFGINKYRFQFVINGTQLTSFGNMNSSQRKVLLNKALGVDIYDKIHKLATEDYRFTNKLIASLTNTQEYLMRKYGSYESLSNQLAQHKQHVDELTQQQQDIKTRMDMLSGRIMTIKSQNPIGELADVDRKCRVYSDAVSMFGTIEDSTYDTLVNDQLKVNQELSNLQSQYHIILHDIDELYAKRNDINSTIMSQQQAISDLENMERMRDDLRTKIENIEIIEAVQSTQSQLRSILTLGQAINSICSEISTCLSDNHLQLFSEMVISGIDISVFILQEGSILMDTEKEKTALSRIQSMIFSVKGDEPTDCEVTECLYRKTYDTLREYFKSYQSASKSKFTQYDIEQFDHANRNLNSIKTMLVVDIPDEVKALFDLNTIMANLPKRIAGVNIDRIRFLMEEAAKMEQRNQYIKQYTDIENSISRIRSIIPSSIDMNAGDVVSLEIAELESKKQQLKSAIDRTQQTLDSIDNRRLALSSIKNIDIVSLNNRRLQLQETIRNLQNDEELYADLSLQYSQISSQLTQSRMELDELYKANAQYMKTVAEIEQHSSNDEVYKIIAEATSSTKGMPVHIIRDVVNRALDMTNRLLHVMYEDEIQLLKPTIDETTFSLPFRCGINHSDDIRYGSQSENTLLSLALSLSLASTMTPYNVYLIDEIDAYLDQAAKDGFVMMLQEIMITLNTEQIFVISHSVGADQYPHSVYTIDISKRIDELK